jgi:hypothetical protein
MPLAMPATAADQAPGKPMDLLSRCTAIADDAGRLTCYDREVAALRTALNQKQIAIVERGDVEKSKRSLFGISLPTIKLFDNLGGNEIKQIETVVTSVGETGDGRLLFTVTDGAQWVQTDDYPMSGVKPGRKVTLKRASLGTFFAAFDKGVSVRAKRLK